MTDIKRLIEANNLEFGCLKVDVNPYMPQDSADLRHFLCSLTGEALDFEFYVSMGDQIEDDIPSAEFALSLLLEDVAAYKGCAGFSDFARLIGFEEGDRAAEVAFEELARLSVFADTLLALPAAGAAPKHA